MFKVADGFIMPALATDKLISSSRLPHIVSAALTLNLKIISKTIDRVLFHIPVDCGQNSQIEGIQQSLVIIGPLYFVGQSFDTESDKMK